MKQKYLRKKVLFNASAILAGLRSPKGGSAKVLKWAKENKIAGFVSEVIFDEVRRNLPKINISINLLDKVPLNILPAPRDKDVNFFKKIVTDPGDAHVLASAKELEADYLVSLDKKHILILKNKVKDLKIVTPGELIVKLL